MDLADDKRDVLARLGQWRDRIRTLERTLFDGSSHVPNGYPEPAKSQLKALKDDLKEEHRSLKGRRREDPPLTKAEQSWYEKPIGAAATNPSGPLNQPMKWRTYLFDIASDFELAISRLKSHGGKK